MLDSDGGLVRGTPRGLLVLKALMWGPRHGYAVAEWVQTVTEGELLVEEGPSTPRCSPRAERLLSGESGYSDNDRRAKYYQLTRTGRAQLRTQVSRGSDARACRRPRRGGHVPGDGLTVRRVFRLPDAGGARLAPRRRRRDRVPSRERVRSSWRADCRRTPRGARPNAGSAIVESARRSCVTLDEQREQSMRRANFMGEVTQDRRLRCGRSAESGIHVPRRWRARDRHRRQHGDLHADRRGRGAQVAGAAAGATRRGRRPDACRLSFVRLAAHGTVVLAGVQGGPRQRRGLHRRRRVRPDGSSRRPGRRGELSITGGSSPELLLGARRLGRDRTRVRRHRGHDSPSAPVADDQLRVLAASFSRRRGVIGQTISSTARA